MKNRILTSMAALVVMVSLAFAPTAWAQNSANGAAAENTNGVTGNNNTGGDNLTSGMVTYNTGPSTRQSVGYGDVAGAGVSNINSKGSRTTSESSSLLSFNVGAIGRAPTETFNGLAGQIDFVKAKSPAKGDYADGGNETVGSVVGSNTGGAGYHTINSSGKAAANGKTVAGINVASDGLSATAKAKSIGMSDALGSTSGGKPQLLTGVNGVTGIEGGVLVSGPNKSSAGAGFVGNASYNATNPSGGLVGIAQANGKSKTKVSHSGNAATASSAVHSEAQTKH